EGEAVRLPLHQGDVVLADGRVPAVGGAAGDVGAQPALRRARRDVGGGPPGGGAVVEGSVAHLLDLSAPAEAAGSVVRAVASRPVRDSRAVLRLFTSGLLRGGLCKRSHLRTRTRVVAGVTVRQRLGQD